MGRDVLDAEPVIGLAEGEARWRAMTLSPGLHSTASHAEFLRLIVMSFRLNTV
jgi:hypothetical protein